jgi:hypothetical protein
MYKVKFYCYEVLRSRLFDNLSDAVNFCVYKVHSGDVYAIDLIKD